MGESKNIIETLSKLKIVGYLLAGVAFFFLGLSDITYYYVLHFSVSSNLLEALVVNAFYLIGDAACIATAIVLWVISAKILRAKS